MLRFGKLGLHKGSTRANMVQGLEVSISGDAEKEGRFVRIAGQASLRP